jgi:DNA-binding MarR family transcriptional regulator
MKRRYEMSIHSDNDAAIPDAPPYVGALLRLAWQQVRAEMLAAIHGAGFGDFQEAHFAIFSFPLPAGAKPSELARQKRMSPQAINYQLVQLEELGYVERRAAAGSGRRLVYLSPRGLEVADVIFACLKRLHADWARQIGPEKFQVFLEVLAALPGLKEAAAERRGAER